MPLYLLEYTRPATDRATVERTLDSLAAVVSEAKGALIEAQVATDLGRVYVVVEHEDRAILIDALARAGLAADDVAPVRLVGADLAQLKAAAGPRASYLVEWDLPAGLTMERYLARKAAKSPRYATVPDVQFLRTYVREDLLKCLCFYDAPDEAAVRRAREAVEAPIDRLSRVTESARVTR